MKNYFAIESVKKIKGYVYLHIYRIKQSKMEFIGMARYQPQSTRGAESEVMEALANGGEIPKKYGKRSEYYQHSNGVFNIQTIIDPAYMDKCIKYRKDEYLFN